MESSDLLAPATLPSNLEFSMIECSVLSGQFLIKNSEDDPYIVFDKESARGILEQFLAVGLISEEESGWFLGLISSTLLPESYTFPFQKNSLRKVSEAVYPEFSNFPADIRYLEKEVLACILDAARCRIN